MVIALLICFVFIFGGTGAFIYLQAKGPIEPYMTGRRCIIKPYRGHSTAHGGPYIYIGLHADDETLEYSRLRPSDARHLAEELLSLVDEMQELV